MNVTGTPQITLETGGTDAVVDYSLEQQPILLTFNYTVVAGHTSADLDYVATNSLALNSGTIKDAALNVATLTLPAIGAAGSLAVNKAIVVRNNPFATAQSITVSEQVAATITLAGTDPDGDALTYSIVDAPTNGTATLDGVTVTYTSNSDTATSDSFTFKVNDGTVDSSVATVSITSNC